MIKEGDADFDRVSHAHPVGTIEEVVLDLRAYSPPGEPLGVVGAEALFVELPAPLAYRTVDAVAVAVAEDLLKLLRAFQCPC